LKISIITINYNNNVGLQNTIKSVINQTYKDLEYIVIDGGSTAGDLEIIKKHAKYINYWVSEKDGGIYPAMNKGIEKASGDYLMFLNSGDYLLNESIISKCIDELILDSSIDILYGDMFIPDDANPENLKKITHPAYLDLLFLKNNNINHQASLIKRTVFKHLELYPNHYQLAGDYWLYINCFIHNYKFKKIELALVYYDYVGVSKTDWTNYKLEMNQIWEKLVPKQVTKMIEEYQHLFNKSNRRLNKLASYLIDYYYKKCQ
jgi:glycosyltransferase involved in cell wall biosynthesis